LRVVIRIKTPNGNELVIEGESLQQIADELRNIGIELKDFFLHRKELEIIPRAEKIGKMIEEDISNLFEVTDKGPLPIVDISHLSVRESILLILYGAHIIQNRGLRAGHIVDLLRQRGFTSSTSSVYARIAELKKDGFILKDKDELRLTKRGLDLVKSRILQKIRA